MTKGTEKRGEKVKRERETNGEQREKRIGYVTFADTVFFLDEYAKSISMFDSSKKTALATVFSLFFLDRLFLTNEMLKEEEEEKTGRLIS